MKKINSLIVLLLGILMLAFGRGHPVAAATDVQVTIQHVVNQQSARGQPTRPGAFAHFTVYDMTATAHERSVRGEPVSRLAEALGQKDDQAIGAFIKQQHLRPVANVETDAGGSAHFAVSGAWGNAYLIVQTTPGFDPTNALNVNEKALPIVLSFPQENQAQGVTIVTKAVRVQRAVYFYKYGRSGRETAPLKGAIFAVRRAGAYLTTAQRWLQTKSPLADHRVLKMHSQADGLVMLKGVPLAPGSYVVQELKAPKGYALTRQAQQIRLSIPRADTMAQITVNGVALRPLLADRVQRGEASRTELRIYNPIKAVPPKTPGGNGPGPRLTHYWGHLPQTGEAKASLALLGSLIIGFTVYYWKRHLRQGRECNK
ncbi:pilin N-terminal domain-containing protein [Lacticaseibacillus camelliae]|nr:SpaA isopeptide-forming pilin-related protein [Lacticaseibacillus camelliae]